MRSRFGVKDAIVILAVLALAAIALTSMVQSDRLWDRTRSLESRLTAIESRLAQLASGGGATPDEAGAPWARDGAPSTTPERLASAIPFGEGEHDHSRELVVALEGEPRTLTPYVFTDSFALRVLEGNILESLGGFDPETTELRGVLADAWQMDPAGLWLRVRIDGGARFSDGTPVTSDDVVFTFNEILTNPLVNAPRFRETFASIRSVERVNARAVEFTFAEPMFNNLTLALRFPILPKHIYEAFTPEQLNRSTGLAVGSGPYRFASATPESQWTPGTGADVVLERNESYWGGRPRLASIRYRVMTDAASRLRAITEGEAHIARLSPTQFESVSADETFPGRAVSWRTYESGYTYIAWRCAERDGRLTPFHDERVRRAMTMLLDRGHIAQVFYRGTGFVSAGPFSSVTPQGSPAILPHPHSPGDAIDLLAQAGWQDRDGDGTLEDPEGRPFVFEFTYPQGSSTSPKIAGALKDACASVGIRMEERVLDFAVFLEARASGDFDALTLAQGVGFPETDPYPQWHSGSIETGGNFVGWSDRAADELIERGRRTLDEGERMEIWHELRTVIHESQPFTFLVDRTQLRAISDLVDGVRATATGLDLRRATVTGER